MCQIRYVEFVFELYEYVKYYMKLKFYSVLVIVIFKNIINVILMEFLIFMWVKYF